MLRMPATFIPDKLRQMPTNLSAEKNTMWLLLLDRATELLFMVCLFSARVVIETPLGIVPIAEELAEKIKIISKMVEDIPEAHLQEHSVEIQLPFLQVALGDFSFIPLVMGDQDANTCQELAEAIYKASHGKKILIVGSSDLSHFYNYNMAKKMDAVVLRYLKDGDAVGLLENLENGTAEACGGGPMVVAMLTARMMNANKAHLLKYANSGDVTGDKSSVVGYAAAVYCK